MWEENTWSTDVHCSPPRAPLRSLPAPARSLLRTNTDIALISKGFQHQFWQAVKAGADQAAKELNVHVTFEGPDNETQVDKQMDMLAAALASKPSAIGFAALDSQAAIPLLQQAKDAGIPVIAFDSGVDSDIPLTTATTDNVAAAALAADKMAELIGDAGKVAVVAARPDQPHRRRSPRRFRQRDQGQAPEHRDRDHPVWRRRPAAVDRDHQVDPRRPTRTSRASSAPMRARPSALPMACSETGAKVVIIGYDSGKAQKDAIRDGLMAGAITQNPVGIGYETVDAAVEGAEGRNAAQGDRHRLLLVRQEQYRRSQDRRGALRLI